MRAQIINTASILVAVVMFSSCDKESLVPISDVTESNSYLKQKSSSIERESDEERTYYGDIEEQEKTFAEGRAKSDYDSDEARQSDDSHLGLSDPEAQKKTSSSTYMNIESDDDALQSDHILAGTDDAEAIEKTSADAQLGKKHFGANAIQSIQTVESKKGDAVLSGKDDVSHPNTIKTNTKLK